MDKKLGWWKDLILLMEFQPVLYLLTRTVNIPITYAKNI